LLVFTPIFQTKYSVGEYGYCGNKTVDAEAESTFNFTDNWGFCLESKASVLFKWLDRS
jgi:hypothetical protein